MLLHTGLHELSIISSLLCMQLCFELFIVNERPHWFWREMNVFYCSTILLCANIRLNKALLLKKSLSVFAWVLNPIVLSKSSALSHLWFMLWYAVWVEHVYSNLQCLLFFVWQLVCPHFLSCISPKVWLFNTSVFLVWLKQAATCLK